MKLWLKLPAAWSHALAGFGTEIYSALQFDKSIPACESFTWKGMHFPNRWGIAGGVDKNADHVKAWWNLGAGFVEVGTVTLEPQDPNPGKIINRDVKHQALWNRMGFPGEGAAEVSANLKQIRPYRSPVFINIGKNRTTADADAPSEYAELYLKLKRLGDAFVINISSPNTQGLRQWLEPTKLQKLLEPTLKLREKNDPPVFLKLSPDQPNEDLKQILMTAWKAGVDGFILTNTTLARESGLNFPPEGGVSGRPLSKRSEECLKIANDIFNPQRTVPLQDRPLLISVGGVMTAEDVFARLELGADLVQCYAALVFEGPSFFKNVAAAWLEKNGNRPAK